MNAKTTLRKRQRPDATATALAATATARRPTVRCWSAAAGSPESRPRWTSRRPGSPSTWSKKVPTIGGTMARLDKTFPTGDCATCIISPKLVQCMRDYNIEVLTMADVESLEGEAGAFKVEVQRRPRGVIAEKCTGCGDCWSHCPVRYVPQPSPPRFAARRALSPAQDAAWVDAILARYRDDPGPADPRPPGRDRRAALSAPPRAGVPGRAAEDPLAEILRVASFYNAFSLAAGRAAHDRDLPGHGVLRPRLGAAAGTAGAGDRRRRGRDRLSRAVHPPHGPLHRLLRPGPRHADRRRHASAK